MDPADVYLLPAIQPRDPADLGSRERSRLGRPSWVTCPLYPWHTYQVCPAGMGSSRPSGDVAVASGKKLGTPPNRVRAMRNVASKNRLFEGASGGILSLLRRGPLGF